MPALVSIKVKKNQSLCGKGFTKKSVPEMLVRSSRSHVTYEEVALKDFPKLTAKQVETATGSFFLNIYIYIYIYIYFLTVFTKFTGNQKLQNNCFPVSFAKFLGIAFSQNSSWGLLLNNCLKFAALLK